MAEAAHRPLGPWEKEQPKFADLVLARASGPGFEPSRQQGRGLAIDEAVAYALDADDH